MANYSGLSAYLPLSLTHFQIPPGNVAPCHIVILVSQYGVLPQPVDIPRYVTHDVVRQKNKLQPQDVENTWLLIAASAQSNNQIKIFICG